MKSRKFISVFLSFFLMSNIVFSQNTMSKQYPLNSALEGGEEMFSYVTLLNKSDLRSYGIGVFRIVTGALQLSVFELDNSGGYLQPINSNQVHFDVHGNYGDIILKDGFFDEDENIVVYGHENYDNKGVIIKIFMDNGSPSSIKYVLNNAENTAVIDGCWSQYVLGNNVFKTYDFIVEKDNGILYRTDYNLASRPSKKFNATNYRMTSVEWDDNHKKHIIGGTSISETQNASIIGHFDNSINMTGGTFYFLEPSTATIEKENSITLSGNGYYYEDIVYMCQDISSPYSLKGFCISEFNYMTGTINKTMLYNYSFNYSYHFTSGIAHNFMNLFVLGYNTLSDRRFIAQIDLYDYSNCIIGTIANGLVNTGTLFPYKSSIRFDDVTFNVVSTMTNRFEGAYITEAFDFNFDPCTNPSIMMPTEIDFEISSVSAGNIATGASLAFTSQQRQPIDYNMVLNSETFCPIDTYNPTRNNRNNSAEIEKIKKILEEKVEKYNNRTNISENGFVPTPEISVIGNEGFVCKNFEGKCDYKIYDMSGRIIYQGTTQNDNFNNIELNNSGIYIINVKDKNNQIVNMKFVITE